MQCCGPTRGCGTHSHEETLDFALAGSVHFPDHDPGSDEERKTASNKNTSGPFFPGFCCLSHSLQFLLLFFFFKENTLYDLNKTSRASFESYERACTFAAGSKREAIPKALQERKWKLGDKRRNTKRNVLCTSKECIVTTAELCVQTPNLDDCLCKKVRCCGVM